MECIEFRRPSNEPLPQDFSCVRREPWNRFLALFALSDLEFRVSKSCAHARGMLTVRDLDAKKKVSGVL